VLSVKYVIIDTSSILYGFSYNRNVFETAKDSFPGYGMLVSRGILRELTKLSSNSGRKGLRARIALLEIKAKKINVDNISINADKWILNTSIKNRDYIVVTNDTALARKLSLAKVKVFKMSKNGVLRNFDNVQ
jgi:rRNA-processing protein FCF1